MSQLESNEPQTSAGDIRTPTLLSPPESKTPPTEMHPRHANPDRDTARSANTHPIDASALSRALENFEQTGRQRERTPEASPRRNKRQRVVGDR